MPTNRALTLSAKDVSKAVDSAVKLVGEKHKVKFAPEFRIGPGTIMGRQLLATDIGLQQAEKIAAEIAQHAAQQVGRQVGAGAGTAAVARPKLEPVVLVRPGLILCGFYPGPIPELEQKF
jgi:hypothetical protein